MFPSAYPSYLIVKKKGDDALELILDSKNPILSDQDRATLNHVANATKIGFQTANADGSLISH